MRVSDKSQSLELEVEVENEPKWLTATYSNEYSERELVIRIRNDNAEWPNEFNFAFTPKDKDALACVIDALQKVHADMCVQQQLAEPAKDEKGRAKYECRTFDVASPTQHRHVYSPWQPVTVTGAQGLTSSPFYLEHSCPCGHREVKQQKQHDTGRAMKNSKHLLRTRLTAIKTRFDRQIEELQQRYAGAGGDQMEKFKEEYADILQQMEDGLKEVHIGLHKQKLCNCEEVSLP